MEGIRDVSYVLFEPVIISLISEMLNTCDILT